MYTQGTDEQDGSEMIFINVIIYGVILVNCFML